MKASHGHEDTRVRFVSAGKSADVGEGAILV